MPKNAKCFIVDDDEITRINVRSYLKKGGHQVVVEASNLGVALEAVRGLESQGVTVAVLDGNLSLGQSTGRDGGLIATAIRRAFPSIKIISLSLGRYDWPDHMLGKGSLYDSNKNVLADLIDSL